MRRTVRGRRRERPAASRRPRPAIGSPRVELAWGMRAPVRPVGVRNGLRWVSGPDLRRRGVSGPLTRFGVHRRFGVSNANRRRALCRLRATLAAENGDLGFLCRNRGVERSAGVPRFGLSGRPARRTAVSRGGAQPDGETPLAERDPAWARRGSSSAPRAHRSDGSAAPSGEHPVRDRHGGGDDRGTAREGAPEAGLGAGLRSSRLVQRDTQREEAEDPERADPDDCRKRCGRDREGEVAGVSSKAHGDEWTAAVHRLLQTKGPAPGLPTSTARDLAGQRSPGETRRVGGRRPSRARKRLGAGPSKGAGPVVTLASRRPPEALGRQPRDHCPRGADRVGFLDRIGFRYHHGGRRDRLQRTGNT